MATHPVTASHRACLSYRVRGGAELTFLIGLERAGVRVGSRGSEERKRVGARRRAVEISGEAFIVRDAAGFRSDVAVRSDAWKRGVNLFAERR